MILTYKIKHGRDFSDDLRKAKQIATYAIKTKSRTSKDVRHIGLKSVIANQILRKYSRRGIKGTKSVKLTVPRVGVKLDDSTKTAYIPSLKLDIDCSYMPDFLKIRQVELGPEYAYCSVDVQEKPTTRPEKFIGVDCNTTGHVAVAAIPHTGKIHKLGKEALHMRTKYKNIRKRLQKQGKYSMLAGIKRRESNILRTLNHKISARIVEIAVSEKSGIRFEKLKGIRKNKKHSKKFRYSLNSWSYYQLQQFVAYKARKQGIEVAYTAPAYTSKTCSRCGSLGNRQEKLFQCVRCGHADHADVNAAFNIGKPVSHCALDYIQNMGRLHIESDVCKGSTDTPPVLVRQHYKTAIARMRQTVEPLIL
ncbi:MAG: RNA-guided endonuclease InsQ/TnpB family protein [Nitrosotalea sp.]